MVEKGFYSREEVNATGLPFWTGTHWIGELPEGSVVLTRIRCLHFDFPVSSDEKPVAFRYMHKGPGVYKYVPVYDRTSCSIDRNRLINVEVFRKPGPREIERMLIDLKSRRFNHQLMLRDPSIGQQEKARMESMLDEVQWAIGDLGEVPNRGGTCS